MMTVSLCIATYRRPDRLQSLLADLAGQQRLPDELIVVDNDSEASARAVIDRCRTGGAPFPIHYDVQPVKNISLTRNRTVELAKGDWLAFIDDDERAPAGWLRQLLEAAQNFSADGILGPVDPVVPEGAPSWIKRGSFYEFPRMPSGTLIAPNRLRFGNVLLRGSSLRSLAGPFDPAFGLTGGEDGDMLSRMALAGAKLVWCDEATVLEPVEASRLSLRWLLKRSLRGGQDFARHTLGGRYGPLSSTGRIRFISRAVAQALLAAGLAMISWPMGRHHAARWLTTVSANLGKLSVFWGWQYREYA